jgi:hypothetical protein
MLVVWERASEGRTRRIIGGFGEFGGSALVLVEGTISEGLIEDGGRMGFRSLGAMMISVFVVRREAPFDDDGSIETISQVNHPITRQREREKEKETHEHETEYASFLIPKRQFLDLGIRL